MAQELASIITESLSSITMAYAPVVGIDDGLEAYLASFVTARNQTGMPIIPMEHTQPLAVIGQGGSAKVYAAALGPSRWQVAVKVARHQEAFLKNNTGWHRSCPQGNIVNALETERAQSPLPAASIAFNWEAVQREEISSFEEAHIGLRKHPYTTRTLGLLIARSNAPGIAYPPTMDPKVPYFVGIVQQLVPCRSLDYLLRQLDLKMHPRMAAASHKLAGYLAWQLSCGVAALHEAGIMHRDLKPHQFLMTLDQDQGLRLQLSDFGTARQLPVTDKCAPACTAASASGNASITATTAGSSNASAAGNATGAADMPVSAGVRAVLHASVGYVCQEVAASLAPDDTADFTCSADIAPLGMMFAQLLLCQDRPVLDAGLWELLMPHRQAEWMMRAYLDALRRRPSRVQEHVASRLQQGGLMPRTVSCTGAEARAASIAPSLAAAGPEPALHVLCGLAVACLGPCKERPTAAQVRDILAPLYCNAWHELMAEAQAAQASDKQQQQQQGKKKKTNKKAKKGKEAFFVKCSSAASSSTASDSGSHAGSCSNSAARSSVSGTTHSVSSGKRTDSTGSVSSGTSPRPRDAQAHAGNGTGLPLPHHLPASSSSPSAAGPAFKSVSASDMAAALQMAALLGMPAAAPAAGTATAAPWAGPRAVYGMHGQPHVAAAAAETADLAAALQLAAQLHRPAAAAADTDIAAPWAYPRAAAAQRGAGAIHVGPAAAAPAPAVPAAVPAVAAAMVPCMSRQAVASASDIAAAAQLAALLPMPAAAAAPVADTHAAAAPADLAALMAASDMAAAAQLAALLPMPAAAAAPVADTHAAAAPADLAALMAASDMAAALQLAALLPTPAAAAPQAATAGTCAKACSSAMAGGTANAGGSTAAVAHHAGDDAAGTDGAAAFASTGCGSAGPGCDRTNYATAACCGDGRLVGALLMSLSINEHAIDARGMMEPSRVCVPVPNQRTRVLRAAACAVVAAAAAAAVCVLLRRRQR